MANVGQEPFDQGSAMVDTSGTDQEFHAIERNALTIQPLWDTTTELHFAAWDISSYEPTSTSGRLTALSTRLDQVWRKKMQGATPVLLRDIRALIARWVGVRLNSQKEP
jgi:hypothetical protein